MSPEQARRIFDALSPETKAQMADFVQRLSAAYDKVAPALRQWQAQGIEAAERYANGEEIR